MHTKKHSLYFLYTLCFLLTAAMVFSFFLYTGKTMMWRYDGIYQHYNAFLYLGSWVRQILKTLWTEHRLIIPMFEWGLGYGSDVITTLSYYTFLDPFALLSVFTPQKYGEIGYILSIFLRFYAAGLAFLAYAKRMGCANFSALCGALMYIFCTYSIATGVRHPYFINPMIYLPLILLGCEKIIKKESPFPFTLSVFVAAISNFYFFYMLVIFTVLYVGLRLLCEKQYRTVKIILSYLLRFTLYALLGCALAAVLLLPNVMNFLGNTRITSAYDYHPFYTIPQYRALWGSAIGVSAATPYTLIGIAPFAYLGLGGILLQKRTNLWTKLFFLAEILFLLFPVAGHVFNGFGYVTNRWVFAWAFLITYMFEKGFPFLLTLNRKQKVLLATGCGLYIIPCICLAESRTKATLCGCILLLLALAFVLCSSHLHGIRLARIHISRARLLQMVSLGLTILCIFPLSYYKFPSREGNYISEFNDLGKGNDILIHDRASAWSMIEDSGFYRIDNSNSFHPQNKNKQRNHLISSGQSTTSIYWSIINPAITSFMRYNNAYQGVTYAFKNLDSRSYLLPLMSAKYYVSGPGKAENSLLPYGYSFLGKREGFYGTYSLYESNCSLPFGFTCKSIISMDAYEKMTYLQRQQALLQGALLETDSAADVSLPKTAPAYNDTSLPYTIACDSRVDYDNSTFHVKEKDAAVTFTFSSGAGELYLELLGLQYQREDTDDLLSMNDDSSKAASRIPLIVRCGSTSNEYVYYTSQNRYAENRTDYLMNLGYSDDRRTSITLKFKKKGDYTINKISVLLQPMDRLDEQVAALKEDTLENVTMETNHITGTISLKESRLLCLSLPYSKGWHAFVDGKEAELLCTDIMLSGLLLSPGSHTITLTYRTPYLFAGFTISFLALLLFIFIYWKRRKSL